MNEVIIGCPCKNDLACLDMMYQSLIRSTIAYDKIIFIDGGSIDGTKEFLSFISKINPKVEVLFLDTKTPLEAYNKLFEIAKERKCDLLLTQTDVIFPIRTNRDWLYEMKLRALNDEPAGAVIPYNGGNFSGEDYIKGFYWIGGWCSYITNRVIEKLGGYDTNFPNGYGVDVDYTYRLQIEGFRIGIIDYWVDHTLMNSREHDNDTKSEEMKKESASYFRKKWNLPEPEVKV